VILEKNLTFQKALELDRQVWQILPKIQARKIRELLDLKDCTLNELKAALEFKLDAEDYEYKIETSTDKRLDFSLLKCPWLRLLEQSGREDLAPEIGETICGIEYQVWANEFGVFLTGSPKDRLCRNGKPCILQFTAKPAPEFD
jgi:hypothetical protein